MKKAYLAAVLSATLVAASPAWAATTINLIPIAGTQVGSFGNLNPSGTGTDVFSFSLPQSGEITAGLLSVGFRLFGTNLDFTKVTLNGVDFGIDSTGVTEMRSISQAAVPGPQTISVGYKNAQAFSSYGGVVTFVPAVTPAVPEPATWAMMLVGFGVVGFGMRRAMRRSNEKFDGKIKQITYGAIA